MWTPYGCYQHPTSGATFTEKVTYKEQFRRIVEIGREEGLDEAAADRLDAAFREGEVVRMWSVDGNGRGRRTVST